MQRLDAVITELESARDLATARFASEVNMPVSDFLRHFRIVMQTPHDGEAEVLFRVEPHDS